MYTNDLLATKNKVKLFFFESFIEFILFIESLNPPKSAELSHKLMISKKDWKTVRPQVEELAQEIYSEQQERILKNILLKTHEFFLIKM